MKVKGILIILLSVAVAVGVVVAWVCFRPKVCEKIEVRIEYTGPDSIITPSEILDILKNQGIQLVGVAPGNVSRSEIVAALRTNVWFDTLLNLAPVGSSLVMDVRLKSPILAVYPHNGLPYFIGKNGEMLPDNSRVCSPLMVLNGNVKVPSYRPNKSVSDARSRVLSGAFALATAIDKDTLFASQLTQIYATPNAEFEVYNVLGNHLVRFGQADNIDQKLKQLHIVYDNALVYMGLDAFAYVDVRFRNRVFATPKTNL